MKPCVLCQKNEADYCTTCIDESERHTQKLESDKSLTIAFCISCETIVGQKNVDKHVGHHISLRRVQA